jgi:RND family efflux transporter MFP subunit
MILKGEIKSSREVPMPVRVGLVDEVDEKGNPLFPHEGTINFVDNRVDPNSGTLRLRGVFPNPPSKFGPNRIFSPGMFVRVRIPIGNSHPAVLVAERVLGTDQGQSYVYVVKDQVNDEGQVEHRVEYRPVKVGPLHEGLKVVEGVNEGERVIVSGLQRVRAGKRVIPTLVDMPVQSAASKSPQVTAPGQATGSRPSS